VPKTIDSERLEKLKKDIESLKLRFPVATISRRMAVDQGNVSAYLSGKKPISERFLHRFYICFTEDLQQASEDIKMQASPASILQQEPVAHKDLKKSNQGWETQEKGYHVLIRLEIKLSKIEKVLRIVADQQKELFNTNKERKGKKKPRG